MNDIELEKKIAKMLATQFYNGTRETSSKRKIVAGMTRDEYISKSLINWIPAARGIITLVKDKQKK